MIEKNAWNEMIQGCETVVIEITRTNNTVQDEVIFCQPVGEKKICNELTEVLDELKEKDWKEYNSLVKQVYFFVSPSYGQNDKMFERCIEILAYCQKEEENACRKLFSGDADEAEKKDAENEIAKKYDHLRGQLCLMNPPIAKKMQEEVEEKIGRKLSKWEFLEANGCAFERCICGPKMPVWDSNSEHSGGYKYKAYMYKVVIA